MATRNTIKGVGEKNKEQTNNMAWVKSSARRLSCDTLHYLSICRLSLTCSFCKISTSYEECWLILTGLPSLLLDSISCRLISSAVQCQLPFCVSRRWLLPLGSFFQLPGIPLPTSGLREISILSPLFGFAPRQNKGIVCLADYLHSVTREHPFSVEMLPLWLKHMYSILSAFTWRPMQTAAHSRLCNRVSAWVGVFARSTMSA